MNPEEAEIIILNSAKKAKMPKEVQEAMMSKIPEPDQKVRTAEIILKESQEDMGEIYLIAKSVSLSIEQIKDKQIEESEYLTPYAGLTMC